MEIKSEKSAFHTFTFYYEYNAVIVDFCRALKEQYGWQHFTYNSDEGQRRWVFSDVKFIELIRRQFPDVVIDPVAEFEYKKVYMLRATEKSRQEKIDTVKEKTDTSLEIKGLKGELYPYQKVGVEFILASGGRALIADAPGCISGDTKITVNRGKCARTWTMRELFHSFNGGERMGKNGTRSWDLSIPTKIRVHQDGGLFKLTPIKRVISSGEKKVINVNSVTDKGKKYSIELTPDHLILTDKGWVEAGKLNKGDTIIVNGKRWCTVCNSETRHADSLYTKKWGKYPGECCKCTSRYTSTTYTGYVGRNGKGGYLEVGGLYHHPIFKNKIRSGKTGSGFGPIMQHVLVYEATKNNIPYDEWCDMCRFNNLPKEPFFVDTRKYAIHHINGVKTDNVIDNLEMLTHSEHSLAHKDEHIKKLWNVVSQEATVTSVVDERKVIDTYDIEMSGEYPNFIANGVVVHNCGKTLQALAYIQHKKYTRSLVIAPASVKSSWAKEIEKWTELPYVVIDSKTKIKDIPKDIKVWVINYDILKKHLDALMKIHFNLVVCDESHLVKSPKAQRTKAVMMLVKKIKDVIMLSGTPLLSRPVEMFTLLHMIDPGTWNNWYEFTRRYCNGHQDRFGYNTSGSTNSEELHERIKRYFIRRKKEDVLTDLPPKVRIPRSVPLSPKYKKEYMEAENDLAQYLYEHKGKQSAEIASAMAAEQLARLNILRQLSALGKMEAAKEVIDSILEAGEKVIVFSSFMEPLAEMKSKYKDKVVQITGSTPVHERGDIVTQFQEDPKKQIFLGGIKSAGVGITLTAASNVVFLDYAWNPSDMIQAEDRIHRPGQEAQSANIFQLHSPGTVDERLLELLKTKQIISDRVIDGKGVTWEDLDAEEKNAKMAKKAVIGDILKRNKEAPVTTKDEFEELFG